MRRSLTLALGVFIGQWLAFAAAPSPANFHALGLAAWERRDDVEALRQWSHGVALQPDNPPLHYRRATALAPPRPAAGHRRCLPSSPPARRARRDRASGPGGVVAPRRATAQVTGAETTVPVESARGVWVASVVLNGQRTARFIVDTGSSFTIVAPGLATALGLPAAGTLGVIELQTLAGHTIGAATTLSSLRVGAAELRDVPVVVHDPGPEIDGILGKSFLAHDRFTLDADRRHVHLRPAVLD